MSNVNQIIELWDTDRVGNDAEFHYVTPEMDETQEARKFRVSADDLRTFIEENQLNQFQTDVDDFKPYDAHDHLMDNWEEVVKKLWIEVAGPRLEQNYADALAYMQSFISKCAAPLSKEDSDRLRQNMVAQFGVKFGKEAA